MKYIIEGWNWLVFSSVNSNKMGLTVKAFLVAALTYGTVLAGFADGLLRKVFITFAPSDE
jgi:hypothetical protein